MDPIRRKPTRTAYGAGISSSTLDDIHAFWVRAGSSTWPCKCLLTFTPTNIEHYHTDVPKG